MNESLIDNFSKSYGQFIHLIFPFYNSCDYSNGLLGTVGLVTIKIAKLNSTGKALSLDMRLSPVRVTVLVAYSAVRAHAWVQINKQQHKAVKVKCGERTGKLL